MKLKERIRLVIGEEPVSLVQIAAKAFTVRENARRYVKALLDEGSIHIARWTHGSRGPYFPLYVAGPGRNAERPPRQTYSDRSLQYRHRLRKKFGEHYGKIHAAQKKRVPGRQVVIDDQVVYQQ